MNKKPRISKSKVREAKRHVPYLALFSTHFFETTWAVGTSVAAAMVISPSTH